MYVFFFDLFMNHNSIILMVHIFWVKLSFFIQKIENDFQKAVEVAVSSLQVSYNCV